MGSTNFLWKEVVFEAIIVSEMYDFCRYKNTIKSYKQLK